MVRTEAFRPLGAASRRGYIICYCVPSLGHFPAEIPNKKVSVIGYSRLEFI